MAGQAHKLIQQVMDQRTKGNQSLSHFIRAQLLLRGIDPEKHTPTSEDPPAVIEKLEKMLKDFDR